MRISQCLVLTLFAALIAACSPGERPVFGEAVAMAVPASGWVSGPRFSEGPGDELVLSWMESGENDTSLNFARLDGNDFGVASKVVDEPGMFVNWADLPSVTHIEGEHWVAHWLRYSADATYSYDVVLSQSFDDGATWGEAVTAHTDGTPTEHGFVSMHRDKDGIALLWLDGRDTAGEPQDDVLATSMTLRSAVIAPDGTRLKEQLVDDSVCDCCQTDVAVSAGGPIAVYRDRTADEIRDIYITRFVDGAWRPGVRLHADNWKIAGCPVNGPSIVARENLVAVSWFTAAHNNPAVLVVISEDGGESFSAPIEIATGRIAGYVGLVFLDDASVAVSWVGRSESDGNDLRIRRLSLDGQAGPVHHIRDIHQLRVFPQLAYRGGHLILVWTDETGDARQMHAARVPVALP